MTEGVRQARARTRGHRLTIGFLLALLHVLPIVALIIGTKRVDWIFLACLYPFQAIGIGISLHRYFAHRSFKTSRPFQFFLALCSASTFGDPIGFAGKHRLHHQHVDSACDVHTPLHGWWACWFGNLLDSGYTESEILERAADWQRYPELVWLHRNPRVPGLVLIALALIVGGFTTAAIGVCLGAVICLHQTSAVNYFTHKVGSRRFDTPDRSTNNWIVGLLTYGEGWHNNHHHFPASARAGFAWWEIDMFFWVILVFEKCGLIWDVRRPPQEVLTARSAVRV